MKLPLRLATQVHTLVLVGGGEFSFGETREIDEFLVASLPPDRKRVAFLPTASGSAEYAVHFGKYLQGIDPSIEVVNVPVYRGRDNRRPKNLNAILGAGLVYLGGGVTNTLLETIRQSPAEMALREAAAQGAVIAAIGASASSFGTHVRDMRRVGAIPGLGWIHQTVIETGFDPEHDQVLRRLMSLDDVELGLGIPAGTALVVDASGEGRIVGSGQVAAFRKK